MANPDELLQWPELGELVTDINAELAGGTERGLVTVCASMADVMLERLLVAFLIDADETRELISAGERAPLGNFAARINAAFCLGLIGRGEMTRLHMLRRIRNDMAHRVGQALHDSFTDRTSAFSAAGPVNENLALGDSQKQRFASAAVQLLIELNVCHQFIVRTGRRLREGDDLKI